MTGMRILMGIGAGGLIVFGLFMLLGAVIEYNDDEVPMAEALLAMSGFLGAIAFGANNRPAVQWFAQSPQPGQIHNPHPGQYQQQHAPYPQQHAAPQQAHVAPHQTHSAPQQAFGAPAQPPGTPPDGRGPGRHAG